MFYPKNIYRHISLHFFFFSFLTEFSKLTRKKYRKLKESIYIFSIPTFQHFLVKKIESLTILIQKFSSLAKLISSEKMEEHGQESLLQQAL